LLQHRRFAAARPAAAAGRGQRRKCCPPAPATTLALCCHAPAPARLRLHLPPLTVPSAPRPAPSLLPPPPPQASKAAKASAGAPKAAKPPAPPAPAAGGAGGGAKKQTQSQAKAAAAAAAAAEAERLAAQRGAEDPLYPSRKKNFRIGNDVQHKRNLTRFVKWPRYVRVQRQRKVLYERLKIPPAINQFLKPLDRAEAAPLFKLLAKYKPESKAEKKARMTAAAAVKAAAGAGAVEKKAPAPLVIKFGLNHVTTLVEEKKAKLVVIASDVDPIELVVWLPALCRKCGVPYVIVNNKGLLGQFVHQKKAAALALVNIRSEDNSALERVLDTANAKFANNVAGNKQWGEGVMGLKTQKRLEKRAKLLAVEQAKRAAL